MFNEAKKVCAIYTRVSTEDQARVGFSLKEQRKILEDHCNVMGYEIYKFYEESDFVAFEEKMRQSKVS